MAQRPGALSDFPWEAMGNYKYALLAPFALAVAAGKDDSDQWYLHMLGIAAVRYALAQVFMTASRIHAISGKNRIQVWCLSRVV